jgi:hypothetical protein
MTRVCCVPDCVSKVDGGRICCLYHWRAIPPRVRVAAQERLRGWKDTGAARGFVFDWWRANSRVHRGDEGRAA